MKRWIKRILSGYLMILGIISVFSVQVNAEENEDEINGEIVTVREADGDLEGLYAILISEEDQEKIQIDEAIQYTAESIDEETLQFLNAGSDYGYQDMDLRSNAQGRKAAYDIMKQGSYAFTVGTGSADTVTVRETDYAVAFVTDVAGYDLTVSEAYEIYFTFRNDNPQYFWLGNSVIISTSSSGGPVSRIYAVTYYDYADGTARGAALEEILTTVRTVYKTQISESASRYEKVKAVHDALILDISYASDTTVERTHSIAGALTADRSAVCEGYAKTIQLLLNYYDIENIYVTGYAGGAHAWNMVQMTDGKWYWLDATWDDHAGVQYWYFLVGNRNFTDHTANTTEQSGSSFLYQLPEVSDDNYDLQSAAGQEEWLASLIEEIWNSEEGAELSASAGESTVLPEAVLRALAEKKAALTLTLANGTQWQIDGNSIRSSEARDTDMQAEATELAEGNLSEEAAALSGSRSREQLIFSDTGSFCFEGVVTVSVNAADDMKAVLLQNTTGSLSLVDTALVKSGRASFCTACGADSVILYGANGDVNGDGTVSLQDLMRVLYHVSGRSVLNQAKQGFADVNMDDDNLVDIADLMSMLYYISGRSTEL